MNMSNNASNGMNAFGGIKTGQVGLQQQQVSKKKMTGWEFEGNGNGLPEGWAGEGSKRKATAAQGESFFTFYTVPLISLPSSLHVRGGQWGLFGLVLSFADEKFFFSPSGLNFFRCSKLYRTSSGTFGLCTKIQHVALGRTPFVSNPTCEIWSRTKSFRRPVRTRFVDPTDHADFEEHCEIGSGAERVELDGRSQEGFG